MKIVAPLLFSVVAKERVREFAKTIANDEFRLNNFYKIKNKEKKTIQFRPNKAQRIIDDTIKTLKKTGKPIRLIILKPRQIGCTTYFIVRNFDQVYWHKNQFCAIIAHLREKAHDIFTEIVKFVYKEIPQELQFESYTDTVNHIGFQETQSQIKVTTDGHGITPNLVHFTEVARMREPKEMIGETLQGLPLMSGIAVLESTANGRGGFFYETWQESVNDPENVWTPIFLEWWHQEEYSLPVTEDFELTEYENELMNNFEPQGLTVENLMFRRIKVKETGARRDEKTGLTGELLFQQNYPMTSQEAFIIASGCIFDVDKLHKMELAKPLPLRVQQIGRGYYKTFSLAEENTSYLIAADTSFGAGKDYSVAIVFEKKTRRIMATLRGKYPSIDFGKYLIRLGKIYNNALLVVERNMGAAVLNHLINYCDYKNVYYHAEFDQKRKRLLKPGFPTSTVTRNIMIGELQDAIAYDHIDILDDVVVAECLNFGISSGKGKVEAMTGNDDCVIALAIGNHLCTKSLYELTPPQNMSKPPGI